MLGPDRTGVEARSTSNWHLPRITGRKIPRDRDDDYGPEPIAARQAFVREQTGSSLEHVSSSEIVAATVLAGEFSLGAAVVAEEWVQAHDELGRNRP